MTPAELQQWRYNAGLSQAGLAALLGVDVMTVSNWERGVRGVPTLLPAALYALEHGYADQTISKKRIA